MKLVEKAKVTPWSSSGASSFDAPVARKTMLNNMMAAKVSVTGTELRLPRSR